MSVLDKLGLPQAGTVAVVDTQWGDTGKGKMVDLLAAWADIIARGTGGANAGHTVVVGDNTYTLHLIPSGILRDKDGVINIIGNGVAVDPRIVIEELDLLASLDLTTDNLLIARNAHLVLPQHLVMDRVAEVLAAGDKIGTTGRGIGPLYTDHAARTGLMVMDMLNPALFREKLVHNLAPKLRFLRQLDASVLKELLHHEHLESGRFWDEKDLLNVDAVVEAYEEFAIRLRPHIADTDTLLRESLGKKKVLLEGAQGVLLSVDHGFRPYVTSSDASIAGLAKGVGIHEGDIDRTLSIVKAFYMTRVGEGAFPTELGGALSAKWCGNSTTTKTVELERYPEANVNSADDLEQGIGMRLAGAEYGATTARPRRTGWLDLPLLRYAMMYSSKELILTKLDVLDECKSIKICTTYTYTGPDYDLGDRVLKSGDTLSVAIADEFILGHCEPVYAEFPGWVSETGSLRTATDLPKEMEAMITFLEEETGAKVVIASIGSDRAATMVL